jgi:hypothetical protein
MVTMLSRYDPFPVFGVAFMSCAAGNSCWSCHQAFQKRAWHQCSPQALPASQKLFRSSSDQKRHLLPIPWPARYQRKQNVRNHTCYQARRSFQKGKLLHVGTFSHISHLVQIQQFQKRFKKIPRILELDHLTVTGDVYFGRNVTLRGTVIGMCFLCRCVASLA